MFLILLFKLLTHPFVSFLSISILSLLPFLNPLSSLSLLPLHHPFFLFWSILCPPKIKTSIYYILFTNGTYFAFCFTLWHFNNAFYKLEIKQILMLELQLVIPWGLEETMDSFLIPSLLPFFISPSLSSIPWSSLCPPKTNTSCFIRLFSQAPLAHGSLALPSVLLQRNWSGSRSSISEWVYEMMQCLGWQSLCSSRA